MNTLRVIAIVVGYLATGWILARLRLAQLEARSDTHSDGRLNYGARISAREDMLAVLVAWPIIVPLYVVVQLLRLALYPKRVRR